MEMQENSGADAPRILVVSQPFQPADHVSFKTMFERFCLMNSLQVKEGDADGQQPGKLSS